MTRTRAAWVLLLSGITLLAVAATWTPPTDSYTTRNDRPVVTTWTPVTFEGEGIDALPTTAEVRWVANVVKYDAWLVEQERIAAWLEEEARRAEAERAAAAEAARQQAPTPSNGSVWDRLAQCESNGNWSINTGNGYYGGLQFSLQSWRAVGGTGYPHQHSRAEQILRAERLRAIQGWGAWPVCSRQIGLR